MRKRVFAALGAVMFALSPVTGTAAAEPAPSADLEASAAPERMVTLWTEPEYRGDPLRIYGAERPSGRVCTSITSDIDLRVNFTGVFEHWRRNVESINDNAGAHCDWQLIDRNGVRSTWVEGDIRDLRNLGSGWRNRAVAIRFT